MVELITDLRINTLHQADDMELNINVHPLNGDTAEDCKIENFA